MIRDDGFFWFNENRITVPGVKGEHIFMHITDTHVSTIDEESTLIFFSFAFRFAHIAASKVAAAIRSFSARRS